MRQTDIDVIYLCEAAILVGDQIDNCGMVATSFFWDGHIFHARCVHHMSNGGWLLFRKMQEVTKEEFIVGRIMSV